MAKLEKAKKTEKEEKTEKADKKEAAPEFKYGVDYLAEKLELKPASVRVKLRNAEIAKAGKSYGWNSQKEVDEVMKQIESTKAKDKAA